MSLPPFPNPERILVEDFNILAGGRWYSGGATPRDLSRMLPFVSLRRSGGPSDNVNDYPFLTVEVYALTIAEATDVAEEVRQRLLAGFIANQYGQIDRALCTSAHTEIPAEDPALRRIVTVYRLTCRRSHVPVS